MQFLTVFLQNSCKRSVYTRTTQVRFEPSQTGFNRFGFIGFFRFSFSWNGRTATESPVFSGPVQSQSGFFPVLWTGLLIPRRAHAVTALTRKYISGKLTIFWPSIDCDWTWMLERLKYYMYGCHVAWQCRYLTTGSWCSLSSRKQHTIHI